MPLISDPRSDSWLPQEDPAWGVICFDPLRVLSGMHKHAHTDANTHTRLHARLLSPTQTTGLGPLGRTHTGAGASCPRTHSRRCFIIKYFLNPVTNTPPPSAGHTVGYVCGVCLLGRKSFNSIHTYNHTQTHTLE